MSIFAWLRDNVKYPQLLPGPDIITANVSWNIFLLFRIIAPAVRISHNDDAVNHDGGRAMSNESVFWIYPMDWIDLDNWMHIIEEIHRDVGMAIVESWALPQVIIRIIR